MKQENAVLVTGSAGFIGFHLSKHLLDAGYEVIGVDAITDYYDPQLKEKRLNVLSECSENFSHHKIRIEDDVALKKVFQATNPQVVVHLAAQAGVRYSIDYPSEYVTTNLVGTFNILECSKDTNVKHLLMASTSSVYGSNKSMPFQETQKTERPMSFYAATKKSNEIMAHSYSHIYDIPITMFRFFTVYGPWGRPDMALYKFMNAIMEDRPIEIYNFGNMKRDFTYVEDLVCAIEKLFHCIPPSASAREGFDTRSFDSLSDVAPHRIVNIGNSQPVELMRYIEALENAIGKEAKKKFLPMQQGDVPATWADVQLLEALTNYVPNTDVEVGVKKFVDWYMNFHSKDQITGSEVK